MTAMMTRAPIAETTRSHTVLARCSATPDVKRSSAFPMIRRRTHWLRRSGPCRWFVRRWTVWPRRLRPLQRDRPVNSSNLAARIVERRCSVPPNRIRTAAASAAPPGAVALGWAIDRALVDFVAGDDKPALARLRRQHRFLRSTAATRVSRAEIASLGISCARSPSQKFMATIAMSAGKPISSNADVTEKIAAGNRHRAFVPDL